MPYKNPEHKKQYQRMWMAKRRADYIAKHGPCKCGSWDRLEIDHINPDEKEKNIAGIWSYSASKRERELQKCQVLCHSCHELKTSLQKASKLIHGTAVMYNSYGCRCSECREYKRCHMKERRDKQRFIDFSPRADFSDSQPPVDPVQIVLERKLSA